MDVRIATRYYLILYNFFISFYQYINYFRSVLEVAVEVAAVAQAAGPVVEALEVKIFG